MFIFIAFISFILSFQDASPSEISQNGWIEDYELAFSKAQKENKHVLINFTGSDWCGWCKRLDREVFSQEAFQSFANENLILLKIDFPRSIPQSQQTQIKNQSLAAKYGVRGFPTILIADATEKIVLRTGYRQGGAENYVNHIKSIIQ